MQKHCHLAKYQSNMCYWKIHNHGKQSVSVSPYAVIIKLPEIQEWLLKKKIKESEPSDHVAFLPKSSKSPSNPQDRLSSGVLIPFPNSYIPGCFSTGKEQKICSWHWYYLAFIDWYVPGSMVNSLYVLTFIFTAAVSDRYLCCLLSWVKNKEINNFLLEFEVGKAMLELEPRQST